MWVRLMPHISASHLLDDKLRYQKKSNPSALSPKDKVLHQALKAKAKTIVSVAMPTMQTS
jgi:hypothetical protein